MAKAGTIDKSLLDALPSVQGTPVIQTNEQTEKDAAYLGRQLVQGHQLIMAGTAVTPAPVAVDRKRRGRAEFAFGPSLALLPFLAYLTVFLIVPTATVLVGAFQADEGGFTLEN